MTFEPSPEWIPGIARALSNLPDVLVLNPMTYDGWTSLRMHRWLAANQPALLNRTLVVSSVSHPADESDSLNSPAGYLVEPFSGAEWNAAVERLFASRSKSA